MPRVQSTEPPIDLATAPAPVSVVSTLLRFVSCGLLSLGGGLVWRLTVAPARVGIASALAGVGCLLAGFVVGGLLWYWHDVRVRMRHAQAMSDERIIFSFIVFAVVPFAVLALVLVIWLLALFLGA